MLASPLCSEKIFSTYTYWLFTIIIIITRHPTGSP